MHANGRPLTYNKINILPKMVLSCVDFLRSFGDDFECQKRGHGFFVQLQSTLTRDLSMRVHADQCLINQ